MKNKLINLLILFFIFICFLIIKNYKIKHLEPIFKKIEEFESSLKNSFIFTFFIENDLTKIKKFWNLNEKDKLIDNINLYNFHKSEKPDISVIITVYNQEKCFYKALRSVQNQSLKNIEIIIVDDFSVDNSIKIIENYQKNDPRIILLKHSHNYGTIKSRSDGIKLAKGKYITIIDGDDGFAIPDILYKCINIAKIGNLDVIEFKGAYFLNNYFIKIENHLNTISNLNNRIIYQPELKYKFIKLQKENNWSYLNRNIWSKFIKNEIFNKVLEYIGPKYTEDCILNLEDTIMSVSLFIISNSYYLIKEPGYYRSKSEKWKNISKQNKNHFGKCVTNIKLDSIKYLYFLSEKLRNDNITRNLIYNEFFKIDNNLNLCKYEKNSINDVIKLLNLILYKFTFDNYKQRNRFFECKIRLDEGKIL